MTLSKEAIKALITDPKDMEIYELSDEEFRIILLKKLSKIQEHRQTTKQNQEINAWTKGEV